MRISVGYKRLFGRPGGSVQRPFTLLIIFKLLLVCLFLFLEFKTRSEFRNGFHLLKIQKRSVGKQKCSQYLYLENKWISLSFSTGRNYEHEKQKS